jgi:ATP-dependent protease ClpP protease subunit
MRYIIECDHRLSIENPYELKVAPDIVYFEGQIDSESGANFRRELEIAENNAVISGQGVLPICIDSEGGCIYSLMGMIDAIEGCKKAERIKIATIVESRAMSGAVALFSCGDPNHRYMGPNSVLMIHEASGGIEGSLKQMETDTKELRRVNHKYFEKMARNFKIRKDFLQKKVKTEGPEYYISATQAKKLGIIKQIGIPGFETKVTVTHKFKI